MRSAQSRPLATRTTHRRRARLAPLLAAAIACGCADGDDLQPPLARLAIAPGSLTVSGISAGGYMAGQFHVAHSQSIAGAAILAAGPYLCAEGSVRLALGRCMTGDPSVPVDRLVDETRELAQAGRVDPLSGLAGDRVWLFHGARDAVIDALVVDALDAYYRALGAPTDLIRAGLPAAAHTFPTLAAGGECGTSSPPYIGACGYDAAGALLTHLYGELRPRGDAGDGELASFDQRPYAKTAGSHGLAAQGWLFVPRACRRAASCRLHVVFHGCKQGASFVGERFVRDAGYLEWAASNGIVLLFPQIEPSYQPLNPNGCWDWWGYDGSDYATHDGAQIDAVWRMVSDLGAVPSR
jgi:poly(3-hydroxybutyrate) depolymerase